MKYRVWNNATKRFLRTSTYIDSDGNLYKDNDPHGLDMSGKRSISPMPNCTVMRSTGLHDKNGTPIFEGDIFRVEEQADDRMYYLVIHWIKEWCMFRCLTVGEYTDYLATGISTLDEPMF